MIPPIRINPRSVSSLAIFPLLNTHTIATSPHVSGWRLRTRLKVFFGERVSCPAFGTRSCGKIRGNHSENDLSCWLGGLSVASLNAPETSLNCSTELRQLLPSTRSADATCAGGAGSVTTGGISLVFAFSSGLGCSLEISRMTRSICSFVAISPRLFLISVSS